jgi:hypothetical protein
MTFIQKIFSNSTHKRPKEMFDLILLPDE